MQYVIYEHKFFEVLLTVLILLTLSTGSINSSHLKNKLVKQNQVNKDFKANLIELRNGQQQFEFTGISPPKDSPTNTFKTGKGYVPEQLANTLTNNQNNVSPNMSPKEMVLKLKGFGITGGFANEIYASGSFHIKMIELSQILVIIFVLIG
jgi:hypothetical protein